MQKLKPVIFLLALFLLLNKPALAKYTTLEDLQDLPQTATAITDSKIITKDHWAYKTLENITKKHGMLVGKPEEKFDINKPLTRNEAAVILVSLMGKIEQDRIELTETEKAQFDILKQELSAETRQLVGRVENLETSVDTLKGSISNLEEADKHNWKFGEGEKFRLGLTFMGKYAGLVQKGSDNYPSNFSIPRSEIRISGNFQKHLEYVASIRADRSFTNNQRGLLDDAYVATDIIPKHKVFFGQTKIPIGKEANQSVISLETIDYSQMTRNFMNYRDVGIKLKGDWDFCEYYLSMYNGSGINTTSTGNAELASGGWLIFKPLYKAPQFGNLQLGGGYFHGQNTYDYNTYSAYVGYKYKKLGISSELAKRDGYLLARQQANGWYTHLSYDITKKIQLVGRYDIFDPDSRTGRNLITEYTLGGAYKFRGNDDVKLMLNLVHVDNQAGRDSQRILTLTQYSLK